MTDWRRSLIDVKPNNVLISYTSNQDGMREIHGATLSDTEDTARVKKGEGIFAQVSNVLWRSPEAQTGTCVGKASDIWSFGVTVRPPLLAYELACTIQLPFFGFLLTIGPPTTTGRLRHY
jgi:serine/threonine protein kinase